MIDIKQNRLVVFDLDGTLAESKQVMDTMMSKLLVELLRFQFVAVIGGGAFYKFEEQFISSFQCPEKLKTKLFLFPTTASRFYRYENGWQEIYADLLSAEERQKIKDAFLHTYQDIGYQDPKVVYGEVIEDRGTQVTFSALGQLAPLEAKKVWRHSKDDRRIEMKRTLERYIPEFEIALPGYTSIDVTKKGIDKGYGIRKIESLLHITIPEMVFVGDALYEGGNDYPVKATGIECIAVLGPKEVKEIISTWLRQLAEKSQS